MFSSHCFTLKERWNSAINSEKDQNLKPLKPVISMMQSICRHCQLSQNDELGTSPEPAGQTFKMASMAAGFESERKLENKSKWDWNCAWVLCTSTWRTQTLRLAYYFLKGIESDENLKTVFESAQKQ